MKKEIGKQNKKNKKNFFRLSTQLLFTALVMLELVFMVFLSWCVTALIHRFAGNLLSIPDVVWFAVICFTVGSAITALLGIYFFSPITELGKAMRGVAEGDYNIELDTKRGIREIRTIRSDFNLMVQELRATEILQTDFVSNVSHEFKTPINAIEGYAMLLQGTEELPEEDRMWYVEKILFNTRRLSKLVGNILLLSKVDNQMIQTRSTGFRLDEQIRQAIVLLEPDWSKKEIEFDVEMERIEYVGNEGLLFHVWINLIGNAIKFNPQAGAICIRLTEQENRAVFVIEDQGPGISQEGQKHIFDKFYQTESSHKEEGNGLGLALVRQILNVSGGTIGVENIPEGGCRFTVMLPGK